MANRYTITKNVIKEYDDYVINKRTIWENENILPIRDWVESKLIIINRDPSKKVSNKLKFIEFVYLTEDEYWSLITGYWINKVKDVIARLNNYIWSKWDKYKSHYHTILTRFQKNWDKRIDTQKDIDPKPNIPIQKEFVPLTEAQKQEIKDKYLVLKEKICR